MGATTAITKYYGITYDYLSYPIIYDFVQVFVTQDVVVQYAQVNT